MHTSENLPNAHHAATRRPVRKRTPPGDLEHLTYTDTTAHMARGHNTRTCKNTKFRGIQHTAQHTTHIRTRATHCACLRYPEQSCLPCPSDGKPTEQRGPSAGCRSLRTTHINGTRIQWDPNSTLSLHLPSLGRESLERGGGGTPSPLPTALTLPQRHSRTPTPAPTAFPTARNRLPQPPAHPP